VDDDWSFMVDDRLDRSIEPVVLHTPRLLLREWRDEDRDSFAAMNQDPLVMKHFPGLMERAASDAGVDRFMGIHASLGYTVWVVEVLHSDRGSTSFAGFTGLMPPSFDPPFAHQEPLVEVGWRLWPQWWGLGIATEAARASVGHGFDVVGLPEILSFTVVANTPSRAVMERIGMRYDGEFDHPRAKPGDFWRRHVLYRMSPDDPRG
jgi:RimJ/RimL family protein N-acetyltransferase